jgi:hypothetical protein
MPTAAQTSAAQSKRVRDIAATSTRKDGDQNTDFKRHGCKTITS